MAEKTPPITKRRVTMRNSVAVGVDAKGRTVYQEQEAVDYVRPDILDAYVAEAHQRWPIVIVSDEPDAGPGGYHGATHVPATLDHQFAGETFPATTPEGK